MPKEDVISLVVEGTNPATLELRFIVEECPQHASNKPAQPGRKVVQNHLRSVSG